MYLIVTYTLVDPGEAINLDFSCVTAVTSEPLLASKYNNWALM